MNPKALDLFCGLGGWSDGLVMEGFDVLGVEIERKIAKLYKHDVVVADVRTLNGELFKGYDLIVGSPPCRDFSWLTFGLGHRWKRPPDPEGVGMELINAYLKFVKDAHPKYWIMENVDRLALYLDEKPKCICKLGLKMKRAFWGNFPNFLMPQTNKRLSHKKKGKKYRTQHYRPNGKVPKHEQWERAKIPLPVARALGKAVRQELQK